MLKLSIYV